MIDHITYSSRHPFPYDDNGVDQLHKRMTHIAGVGERALTPKAHLGRVSAMFIRYAEHLIFNVISALAEQERQHIAKCGDCKHDHRRLCGLWAQLNTWLMENNVPTKRSKSAAEFRREVSDRQYRKLKALCEEMLAQLDANDVITKYEEKDYDAELFAQCFPARR